MTTEIVTTPALIDITNMSDAALDALLGLEPARELYRVECGEMERAHAKCLSELAKGEIGAKALRAAVARGAHPVELQDWAVNVLREGGMRRVGPAHVALMDKELRVARSLKIEADAEGLETYLRARRASHGLPRLTRAGRALMFALIAYKL